jgi:hypothetical protein
MGHKIGAASKAGGMRAKVPSELSNKIVLRIQNALIGSGTYTIPCPGALLLSTDTPAYGQLQSKHGVDFCPNITESPPNFALKHCFSSKGCLAHSLPPSFTAEKSLR